MERNIRISNLRALAIIMVVFGHSIIIYQTAWGLYQSSYSVPALDYIKKWLDLIQMPLFLSLSGYLFNYYYDKKTFLLLIKSKIRRLMVPYFAFALLWLLPLRIITHFPAYTEKKLSYIIVHYILLGENNGHLWYLPCLFLCFIITYVLLKMLDRLLDKQSLREAFILLIISYIPARFFYLLRDFPGVEILRAFSIWWIWFCVGILFSRVKIFKDYSIKYTSIALGLAVFFSIMSIKGIMPFARITTLILIIMFYMLISDHSNKIVDRISKDSFGIYLFHSPLVYITYSLMPNAFPLLVIIINFCIFGGLSLFLVKMTRRLHLQAFIGE